MKTPEIIVKGTPNGEGMIIRYQVDKDIDIFGIGVTNPVHADLGPTWCYLIDGRIKTLIDTGHSATIGLFRELLNRIDKKLVDINRIIITHSHEDHDGNLAAILSEAKPEVWAHSIYERMISYFPDIEGGAPHPELPGSCRDCFMPMDIRKNCLEYHQSRSRVKVDCAIEHDCHMADKDFDFIYTPGHSADAICILFKNKVIFTGDTVLPEITPHPSRKSFFKSNRLILPEEYCLDNRVYGLIPYIESLKHISSVTAKLKLATFPAHRIFSKGRFNLIHDCSQRALEIIQFHIDRCSEIIKIVGNRAVPIDEIVEKHFPESLLKGYGKYVARNEIMAHLEVLQEAGDIEWVGPDKKLVRHTGTRNYLDRLGRYLVD